MFYASLQALRFAAVVAIAKGAAKPVAPSFPAVDYRAIVNGLHEDSAEFFVDDELPSLGEILRDYDGLIRSVSQRQGSANWVVNG
jgi:hypothetical protein